MTSIFCSMGFLKNPKAFLMVLKAVIESTDYRFILFSSGYQPLDSAVQSIASSVAESSELEAPALSCDSTLLFSGRLFCFSGWVLDWWHTSVYPTWKLADALVNDMTTFSDQYHIAGSFLNVQLLSTMLAGNRVNNFLTVPKYLIHKFACYCCFYKSSHVSAPSTIVGLQLQHYLLEFLRW